MGWSQRELAARCEIDQATISRVECAKLPDLTIATAASILDALGVRATLDLRAPFIADQRRQRDIGHARCVEYVARRLRRHGWIVLTEVEVVSGSARGWIDVLAYRPNDAILLVIEVKTELTDIGGLQRQIGWYERESWNIARRESWTPTKLLTAVVLLATRRNVGQIETNRGFLRQEFRVSARDLASAVVVSGGLTRGRCLALIDPLNRTRRWLLPVPSAASSYVAPYADYAALARRLHAPSVPLG
jgi:transcriptional regulator with XRE-family HTH domain